MLMKDVLYFRSVVYDPACRVVTFWNFALSRLFESCHSVDANGEHNEARLIRVVRSMQACLWIAKCGYLNE